MKRLSVLVAACVLLGVPTAVSSSPYVVTLDEVGSNVIATGSGQLDLAGLTPSVSGLMAAAGVDNPGQCAGVFTCNGA